MVAELTNKVNCRSVNVFPWLTPWPCDPNGSAYQILIDSQSCPKWFKVLTKLENKNDKDIRLDLGIDAGEIGYNYGVSSGNISFGGYPGDNNPDCLVNNPQVCWYINPSGNCNTIEGCNGNNCWRDGCRADCQVSCCGSGCN